ncbi:hypothetical protein [Rhodococcus sp. 008]|uniref:hypothetical protein n=1 Tax=Rhodococcus sp. 008 TaxID=1723645 RepID=UPI0018D314FD|nr:hypothetical protein [Rhodococcus sp. 008]
MAAVIVLRPSPGNPNVDNPAAAGSTSSTTTTAGPVTDADTVKGALPTALSSASENCRQSTFTTDGALVISCDIKKSNQLAESFSEYGNSFTASLDLKQARKHFSDTANTTTGTTPWSKTTPAQQESTSATAPPDKYREVTSTWKPASQSTSTA